MSCRLQSVARQTFMTIPIRSFPRPMWQS